ncbi:hypothetical protein X949_5949 [Burkholderia pseudomallei MSHR5609]|nr:hypothetical protein X945_6014 [Burkholderia pseudomallei ABCPW 107]KGS53062.1 hypothetical protein X949_5949 [Burkholderia pseudomallei MSHR5609]
MNCRRNWRECCGVDRKRFRFLGAAIWRMRHICSSPEAAHLCRWRRWWRRLTQVRQIASTHFARQSRQSWLGMLSRRGREPAWPRMTLACHQDCMGQKQR